MPRAVLLMLFLCPVRGTAQIIRGKVVDAATNAPIQATNLTVLGSKGEPFYSILSSEDGTFQMIIPNGKEIRLKAERIGYQGATSDVIIGKTGELLDVEVRLSPQAVELDPVDVLARKPMDPRLREFQARVTKYQKAGIGRIWTRADLEKRHVPMVSHLLRMIPGRPGMLCKGTALYVDNVRLSVGDDGVTLDDMDMLVSPEDLEGIEVYRDTDIPPDLYSYGRRLDGSAFCMVILAWRKPYSELYSGPPIPLWRMIASFVIIIGIVVVERLAF